MVLYYLSDFKAAFKRMEAAQEAPATDDTLLVVKNLDINGTAVVNLEEQEYLEQADFWYRNA